MHYIINFEMPIILMDLHNFLIHDIVDYSIHDFFLLCYNVLVMQRIIATFNVLQLAKINSIKCFCNTKVYIKS